MDYNPTMYFGQWWDVPMLDGAHPMAVTPVGELCYHCEEPVEEGDQGLMRPVYLMKDGYRMRPIHRECDLRMTLGGVNHLEGRCMCSGGDQDPDPSGVSRREAAQLVFAWAVSHGGPE